MPPPISAATITSLDHLVTNGEKHCDSSHMVHAEPRNARGVLCVRIVARNHAALADLWDAKDQPA